MVVELGAVRRMRYLASIFSGSCEVRPRPNGRSFDVTICLKSGVVAKAEPLRACSYYLSFADGTEESAMAGAVSRGTKSPISIRLHRPAGAKQVKPVRYIRVTAAGQRLYSAVLRNALWFTRFAANKGE
jgi:hypothetical protein